MNHFTSTDFFYLFCFALLPFFSLAQANGSLNNILKGNVVADKNGEPIRNVHIVNLNKEIGTVTNLKGNFEIPALPADTIHITIIGYNVVKLTANELTAESNFANVRLVEKVYQLEEISIYNVPSPEEFEDAFLELEIPEQFAEIKLPNVPKEATYVYDRDRKKMATYVIKGPITALYQKFNKHQRMLAETRKKLDKYEAYNKYLFKLAQSVTKYTTKQDIQEFLHFCNMEVTYIKQYNDYDLTQALEYCFVQYNN